MFVLLSIKMLGKYNTTISCLKLLNFSNRVNDWFSSLQKDILEIFALILKTLMVRVFLSFCKVLNLVMLFVMAIRHNEGLKKLNCFKQNCTILFIYLGKKLTILSSLKKKRKMVRKEKHFTCLNHLIYFLYWQQSNLNFYILFKLSILKLEVHPLPTGWDTWMHTILYYFNQRGLFKSVYKKKLLTDLIIIQF